MILVLQSLLLHLTPYLCSTFITIPNVKGWIMMLVIKFFQLVVKIDAILLAIIFYWQLDRWCYVKYLHQHYLRTPFVKGVTWVWVISLTFINNCVFVINMSQVLHFQCPFDFFCYASTTLVGPCFCPIHLPI